MSNSLLKNLYKVPKKDKGDEMPHFQVFKTNLVHQMDILHMPTDPTTGDKYILVVIDIASRKLEAVPLKNIKSETVAKALAKIYKGKLLKIPAKVEVDNGSEFKGKTLKFLNDKGVYVRVALTGRHRQQAVVERANQTLQKELFMKMTEMELITQEENREWVDNLKDVVKMMNERAEKRKKIDPGKLKELGSGEVLKIGTPVRVALDYPRGNVDDNRLHGKFRVTDIRWDYKNPREILHVRIKPGYPPLYYVNKANSDEIEPVGRTKNQLQVIKDDEQYPDAKKLLKNKKLDKYVVEKIVNDKEVRGKKYVLVKWAGYPMSDSTWELEKNIKEDVPQILERYYRNKKKKKS